MAIRADPHHHALADPSMRQAVWLTVALVGLTIIILWLLVTHAS
jgi:hypothetical protein